MLALAVRPEVTLGGLVGGITVHAGAFIVGVAHPRGRELRQPGIDHGPQLGRGDQLAGAHTVGPLATGPGESALAGAILVGEPPVRVEGERHPVGDLLELIRPQILGVPGQRPFGLRELDRGEVAGQVADELLDHPEVFGVESAGVPGRGGGRE